MQPLLELWISSMKRNNETSCFLGFQHAKIFATTAGYIWKHFIQTHNCPCNKTLLRISYIYQQSTILRPMGQTCEGFSSCPWDPLPQKSRHMLYRKTVSHMQLVLSTVNLFMCLSTEFFPRCALTCTQHS